MRSDDPPANGAVIALPCCEVWVRLSGYPVGYTEDKNKVFILFTVPSC